MAVDWKLKQIEAVVIDFSNDPEIQSFLSVIE